MNSEILLDAIGMINDEIIQDANTVQNFKKKQVMKWCVLAASVCIIVVAGMYFKSEGIFDLHKDNLDTNKLAHSSYPYSDKDVLDYIGSTISDLQMGDETIIFNEIKDIDMYREFNLFESAGERDYEKYYDTNISCSKYLDSNGYERDYFVVSEYRGKYEYGTTYEGYERATGEYPLLKKLSEYFATDNMYDGNVSGEAVYWCDVAGLYTHSGSSANCNISLIMGQNLNVLGEKMAKFLAPMREMLGTEKSSVISGEEVAVQYFYRQRIFKEDEAKVEDCYIYYVYFKIDDVEYLYQYTSNWTVPGKDVSVIHNPPHTMSYGISQEKAREDFIKSIAGLIDVLEK